MKIDPEISTSLFLEKSLRLVSSPHFEYEFL